MRKMCLTSTKDTIANTEVGSKQAYPGVKASCHLRS